MGNRVNSMIDMHLADLRKNKSEMLTASIVVLTKFDSDTRMEKKRCPECGAQRGMSHVKCKYTGRGVRPHARLQ